MFLLAKRLCTKIEKDNYGDLTENSTHIPLHSTVDMNVNNKDENLKFLKI